MANNERFIPIKMTLDLADARRQLNTLDPSVNASAKKIEDRFKSVTSTIDQESKKISSSIGSGLNNETLLRQLDQLRIGAEQLSRGSLGGLPNIIKAIALSSGQAESSIKGAKEQTASFATVVKLLDKSLSDNGVLGQQGGKKLFESFETSLLKASKTGSVEASKLREDFKRFGIDVEQALLKPQKAFNQFLGALSATKKAGDEFSAGNILNRKNPELGSLAVDQGSINAAKEAGRVIKDLTVAEEAATVATGGLSKSTLIAGGVIGGFAVAVIGASVAVVKLSNDAGALQAELEKVGDETGLSADRIQFLQAAAKVTNVEFGSLTKSFEAYKQAANEANLGNKELASIFKILEQTTNDVSEYSFEQLIRKLKGITDEAVRTDIAQKLLKGSARDLSRFYDELNANGGKLKDTLRESSQLMDGEALEAAKEYNTQIGLLTVSFDKLYYKIANWVLPLFIELSNAFRGEGESGIDILSKKLGQLGLEAPGELPLGAPVASPVQQIPSDSDSDVFPFGVVPVARIPNPEDKKKTDALRDLLRKKEKTGIASLQTPPDPRQSEEAKNNAIIALARAKDDALLASTARRIEAEQKANENEYAFLRTTYEDFIKSQEISAELLANERIAIFNKEVVQESQAINRLANDQIASYNRINEKQDARLKQAKTGAQRGAVEKTRAAELKILDNQIETEKLRHKAKIEELNAKIAQSEDDVTANRTKNAFAREALEKQSAQTLDRLRQQFADLSGKDGEAFNRQLTLEFEDVYEIAAKAPLFLREQILAIIPPIKKELTDAFEFGKKKADSLLRSEVLNSQLTVQEEQIRGLQIRGIVNETQATDQLILAKRAMRESLLGELEVRRVLLTTEASKPGKGQDDAKRDLAALDEQIARVRNLGGELTRAESIQLRMAKQGVIEYGRLNERVEDLLASQRGLTEIFQDFRANQVQTAFDGIDSAVNKLTEHLGFAKDLVGDLLKGFLRLAATKVFEKLLNLNSSGGGVSFAGTAPQQGGGFNPLSILQQLGGGGNSGGGGFSIPGLGPGGTAPFQSSGAAGGVGGWRGLVNNALGMNLLKGATAKLPAMLPQVAGRLPLSTGVQGITEQIVSGKLGGLSATPGAGAATAGIGASLGAGGLLAGGGFLGSLAGGSSPIGKLLGGIGGTLGAGAIGASGIFGGGLAAALPALFSNPITAIVAGGLIGGALLFNFLSGRDLKKLRSTIRGEYAIDVADKNILKQVKEFGVGKFGKKEWEKRMPETVRLPDSRELLYNFAQAKGLQGNAKLFSKADRLDPYSTDNYFVRRINGGIIPGNTRGFDHVPLLADGGEWVNRSQTVRREGVAAFDALDRGQATITPNQSQSNSRLEAMLSQLMTMLAANATATNRMALAAGNLESIPASHIVRQGLSEDPDAATDAVASSFGRRSPASNQIRDGVNSR